MSDQPNPIHENAGWYQGRVVCPNCRQEFPTEADYREHWHASEDHVNEFSTEVVSDE